MTTNYSDLLRKIYYTVGPAGFSSIKKLYNEAKAQSPGITLNDVKDWLSGELTYTLHRPARRKWRREPILVTAPGEQYQADLVDMQAFSRQNNGYKYILTIVDCFSRYAWTVPVKSKGSIHMRDALKKVFDTNPPFKLQTDRGLEFKNKPVQDYLKSIGVHYFNTFNVEFKCAIVERFNRTLKEKMFKYFTSTGKRKYIGILPQLVEAYNKSHHRIINTAPINVNENNKEIVFENIYGYPDERSYLLGKKRRPQLNIGDEVRPKYQLNLMDKGYYPNWKDVIYKIGDTIKGMRRPMYKIIDENGHLFQQKFYPEEVQKVKSKLFRIEKLIKKERRNGKDGYIVKWLGYDDSHNSWVPKEAVQNVY